MTFMHLLFYVLAGICLVLDRSNAESKIPTSSPRFWSAIEASADKRWRGAFDNLMEKETASSVLVGAYNFLFEGLRAVQVFGMAWWNAFGEVSEIDSSFILLEDGVKAKWDTMRLDAETSTFNSSRRLQGGGGGRMLCSGGGKPFVVREDRIECRQQGKVNSMSREVFGRRAAKGELRDLLRFCAIYEVFSNICWCPQDRQVLLFIVDILLIWDLSNIYKKKTKKGEFCEHAVPQICSVSRTSPKPNCNLSARGYDSTLDGDPVCLSLLKDVDNGRHSEMEFEYQLECLFVLNRNTGTFPGARRGTLDAFFNKTRPTNFRVGEGYLGLSATPHSIKYDSGTPKTYKKAKGAYTVPLGERSYTKAEMTDLTNPLATLVVSARKEMEIRVPQLSKGDGLKEEVVDNGEEYKMASASLVDGQDAIARNAVNALKFGGALLVLNESGIDESDVCSGNSCEEDVNECDVNNGNCSHWCVNNPGGRSCVCPSYMTVQQDTNGTICVPVVDDDAMNINKNRTRKLQSTTTAEAKIRSYKALSRKELISRYYNKPNISYFARNNDKFAMATQPNLCLEICLVNLQEFWDNSLCNQGDQLKADHWLGLSPVRLKTKMLNSTNASASDLPSKSHVAGGRLYLEIMFKHSSFKTFDSLQLRRFHFVDRVFVDLPDYNEPSRAREIVPWWVMLLLMTSLIGIIVAIVYWRKLLERWCCCCCQRFRKREQVIQPLETYLSTVTEHLTKRD